MKKFALTLIASAMMMGTAHAAPVIQTVTIASAAPGTRTVQFNKFDTLLGTLNSVTLDLSALLNQSGIAENSSNQNKTYTITTGATAGLSGLGFSIPVTLGSGSFQLTIGKKSSIPLGPVTTTGLGSQTQTTNLGGFLGAGTLNLSFLTNSLLGQHPAGGQFTDTSTIGGTATLTYDYTAAAIAGVPEPATWGMMILGFGAVGTVMRRRKNVATKVSFA